MLKSYAKPHIKKKQYINGKYEAGEVIAKSGGGKHRSRAVVQEQFVLQTLTDCAWIGRHIVR